MTVTRAFDLAQFVATPANVNDGVVVSALGPPFTTQFKPLVVGNQPGIIVGASTPAATAPGQTMVSGAGPGFAWTAAASASSLPAPNAQGQTLVAGPGPGYAWTLQIPIDPPSPSNASPAMDSVAAPGTGAAFSRSDHVHPTDTTRYAASNPNGYQTSGQVSAAIGAAAYTLPTASTSTLGGVKVDGSTITIAGGVISSTAVGGGGGLADAPSDGTAYVRQNGAWTNVLDAGTF